MLPTLKRGVRNPLTDVFKVHDVLDRSLDDMFHSFGFPTVDGVVAADFIAPLDLYETDNAFIVQLEAPGMKKEDLSATISDGNTLVIKGKKEKFRSSGNAESHFSERSYGTFHREVKLPKNTNIEDINIEYKEGVLSATIPKIENKEPVVRSLEIH